MINFKTFATLYAKAQECDNIDSYILERGWEEWMDNVVFVDVVNILTDIYKMSVDGINGILQASELNLSQLARKFFVPLKTVQKWKQGVRKPPEYTMLMLSYIVLTDKYFADKECTDGYI